MFRLLLHLFLVFSIVVLLSGCQAIKLADQAEKGITEDQQEKAPTPKVQKPSAGDMFDQVKAKYVEAGDLLEVGEYDKAKILLDEALTLCLSDYDREADKDKAAKLDSLFLEVCVSQVRLGHLRGIYERLLPDEAPLGLEYNAEVERWLSFYLVNGRRSMEIYLTRSGKYAPMMDKILKEKGLPLELKYLPIIESGYSPYAYSSAAAVGVWQFIKGTGKRYGLKIDSWVDERRDPEKATQAAANYLGELYSMFNSWPLALASYNCGEGAVSRAMKRESTDNYWNLSLPVETCNYVPKFYAALLIAREPELYGFFVEYEEPLGYEIVTLKRPADLKTLARITEVSYEELKSLNPELLSQYTHPKVNGYQLKVPKETFEEFKEAFDETSDAEKYLSAKKIAKLKAPARKRKVIYYRVKKGDSLYNIAKKYKTTVKLLKKWNPSARGKYIRPGMKLKIYPGRKR